MATQDYTKLKNAELEALLKQRSLQTGGKKADMVARLLAADAESATVVAPATVAPGPAVVDEDREGEQATTATLATATAQTTTMASSSAGQADEEASTAAPPEKKPTREEREAERKAKAAADEQKYGQGMSATDIDEEIARRKKRADKYGLPLSAEAEEGIKSLERAKKFGITSAGTESTGHGEAKPIAGLDSALPDRHRKRDHEDGGGGRGGKKQRSGGAERPVNAASAPRPNGKQGGSWMSEADKAKAEARRARFAAAP